MKMDQQHHTLQLRILDLIYDILQNWNNEKYDIDIEAQKGRTSTLILIHLKHKENVHSFFKSGKRISRTRSEDFQDLEQFLLFMTSL